VVARRCCPNILPYEVGTPAFFSFCEWNGRSLTDNAPNVMFLCVLASGRSRSLRSHPEPFRTSRFRESTSPLEGFVARPEGLEPPAYWFEASCSIRLSYGRVAPHRIIP
jgi:hypothetical protein